MKAIPWVVERGAGWFRMIENTLSEEHEAPKNAPGAMTSHHAAWDKLMRLLD